MKTILILLLAAVSLSGKTLPPDAAELKAKRDAKVAEINTLYAAALEKLHAMHMKEGNLAGANAIEKEIAAVTPAPFKGGDDDPFNGARWTWRSGGELTIEKGGKAIHNI